jgi:hypothetical protein
MSHQRWHTLEKIQVEVAAAAALAAMYFLLWPQLQPPDVDRVAVFLPLGASSHLLTLAVTTWMLAALVSLLTTAARPQGALLATLVGVGGISLHSLPMRLLRFVPTSTLMTPLVTEQICMAGILAGATVVIFLVRLAVSRLAPAWVRPELETPEGYHAPVPPDRKRLPRWFNPILWLGTGYIVVHLSNIRMLPGFGRKARSSARDVILCSLATLGLTLLIGLMMMNIFIFEGAARGQLLFGLAASFFLAAGVATYFFPLNFSGPCWLVPLLLGIFFYFRAGLTGDTGVLTWMHVDRMANILPVDWLSAGGGGAVGGYWLACRIHDWRIFSATTTAKPAEAAAAKA